MDRLSFDRSFTTASLITLSVMAGMYYFGVALTGELLLVWTALAAWPLLRQGMPTLPGSVPIWAFAWLGCLALVAWHTAIPYASWFVFWTLAGLPLGILVWQLQAEPDRVWGWLRLFLWVGAAIFALWGVGQIIAGTDARAHGPLVDPNGYAGAINLFWFALAARFLTVESSALPRWQFLAMLGILTLLALAFFGAASRGATLAWFISIPFLLWLVRLRPDFKRKTSILLLTWLLGFGLMQALSAYHLLNYSAQAFTGADSSVNARLLIWQATLSMIQQHPLLGTGLGTWLYIYPRFRPDEEWGTTGFYAHNDYLQLAAEGGLVALTLFLVGLGLMAALLRRLNKTTSANEADKIEAASLLVGVMAVSVHAIVNFIFYYAFISILAGVFIGRAWQIYKGRQRLVVIGLPVISIELRKLLMGLAMVVAGVPLLLHQAAGLLNCDHPFVNALQRVSPAVNEYQLAKAINFLRPNEPIPQNIILKTLAQTVDQASSFGEPIQRAVLTETLEAYDSMTEQATMRTRMLADEAMLLVEYRTLLPEGQAITRAKQLALASLKLDPRHAESIIALAETQFAQGNKASGLNILAKALPHVFRIRDQRLLEVAYVKYDLAPTRTAELDDMDRDLRKISPYTVDGKGGDDPVLYAHVAQRLAEITRKAANKG